MSEHRSASRVPSMTDDEGSGGAATPNGPTGVGKKKLPRKATFRRRCHERYRMRFIVFAIYATARCTACNKSIGSRQKRVEDCRPPQLQPSPAQPRTKPATSTPSPSKRLELACQPTHHGEQEARDEDVERAPFRRNVQRAERVGLRLVGRLEPGRHEHPATGRQSERGHLRHVVHEVADEGEGWEDGEGGAVGAGRRLRYSCRRCGGCGCTVVITHSTLL